MHIPMYRVLFVKSRSQVQKVGKVGQSRMVCEKVGIVGKVGLLGPDKT